MKDELQSGAKIFDKVIGPGKAEAMLNSFADICPEFGEWILTFGYTDIYQRPGLDLKIREFITLTSIMTRLSNPANKNSYSSSTQCWC